MSDPTPPEPDGTIDHSILRRVGETLAKRYTLEGVIGVGGMAAVYRGRHRNGNKVAVKILHPELSVYKDMKERFLREGYVANRVEHEGAVRVLDDDTADDGSVFLVMELLQGETLEQRIERAGGTLSAGEICGFTRQLLAVLVGAHEKGIVHRDLKPENLFITTAGVLKVLDFGIARLADGTRQATKTGRVMGTPVYMAPEQARGESKKVDHRTDLWAVGAILYRCLTGSFVHEAETPELTRIHAATRPAMSLRDVLPSTNPRLIELVDRALRWNIEDRWPSAAEMLANVPMPGDASRPAAAQSAAKAAAAATVIDPLAPPSSVDVVVRTDESQETTTPFLRVPAPARIAPTLDDPREELTEVGVPLSAALLPPGGASIPSGPQRAPRKGASRGLIAAASAAFGVFAILAIVVVATSSASDTPASAASAELASSYTLPTTTAAAAVPSAAALVAASATVTSAPINVNALPPATGTVAARVAQRPATGTAGATPAAAPRASVVTQAPWIHANSQTTGVTTSANVRVICTPGCDDIRLGGIQIGRGAGAIDAVLSSPGRKALTCVAGNVRRDAVIDVPEGTLLIVNVSMSD